MTVFVLDKKGKALMPCTEKRARLLLDRGRARVHRVKPFVIRLVDRLQGDCHLQNLGVKLDTGSKTTGMAIVRVDEDKKDTHVLHLINLLHRGAQISEALTQRRAFRRRRRSKLRYRKPRFLNRGNKKKGWIAPSLQHRVNTTMAWVTRFMRWLPIQACIMELVRFDFQKMENPEIEGVEYQQGTLAGYEVREYLLAKWNHKCAYCGVTNTPLNIDHVHPKAKGGSNRVSNLVLSCVACNQKKGKEDVKVFLAHKPERLTAIKKQLQTPLKDAAAVNTTRWAMWNALKEIGLPVEAGSGGRTKFNRCRLSVPKDHCLDAACVGSVENVTGWQKPVLLIKSMGRGSYQRTRLNAYGFPRGYLTRQKQLKGFQTGDIVKAVVEKGKKIGTYTGRVAVRVSGSFNIQLVGSVVQGVSHKYCRLIQRGDGYGYQQKGWVDIEQNRSASPS